MVDDFDRILNTALGKDPEAKPEYAPEEVKEPAEKELQYAEVENLKEDPEQLLKELVWINDEINRLLLENEDLRHFLDNPVKNQRYAKNLKDAKEHHKREVEICEKLNRPVPSRGLL